MRRRAARFDYLRYELGRTIRGQRRGRCGERNRRTGGCEQRHALAPGRDEGQTDRAKCGNPGQACSCYIQDSKHLSAMKKIGQENGYAMAALLIAMSIAAVLLTVAMPTWKQMSRREKEEELVFRGQQYVRAIRLYGQKFANANPPNIDALVEQRFLRRKFKDPITNDDFQPILAGQAIPGSSTTPGGRGGAPVQRGPDASPLASGGPPP